MRADAGVRARPRVYEELDYADAVLRRLGCPVIEVSTLAIEETAHRIIRLVEERRRHGASEMIAEAADPVVLVALVDVPARVGLVVFYVALTPVWVSIGLTSGSRTGGRARGPDQADGDVPRRDPPLGPRVRPLAATEGQSGWQAHADFGRARARRPSSSRAARSPTSSGWRTPSMRVRGSRPRDAARDPWSGRTSRSTPSSRGRSGRTVALVARTRFRMTHSSSGCDGRPGTRRQRASSWRLGRD